MDMALYKINIIILLLLLTQESYSLKTFISRLNSAEHVKCIKTNVVVTKAVCNMVNMYQYYVLTHI